MQQHRHPDPDRLAVDRGDEHFAEVTQGLQEPDGIVVLGKVALADEVVQVVAGGKARAGTTDEDDAHGVIRPRLVQCIDDRSVHREGERVALLRPVEPDLANAVGAGNQDRVAHSSSLPPAPTVRNCVPLPHRSWIASRLLPLVSGTDRHTKSAARRLMTP